ncbi:MAG TPA: hypothetical protein VGP47_03570 [Parachlamydiaceae bacterium]|nr:hypothetical protein [Parachlamydiaceae bacterium]
MDAQGLAVHAALKALVVNADVLDLVGHVVHVEKKALVVNAELQGGMVLWAAQAILDLLVLKALPEKLALPVHLASKVQKVMLEQLVK